MIGRAAAFRSIARRATRRVVQSILIRRILRRAAWPEIVEMTSGALGLAESAHEAIQMLGFAEQSGSWSALMTEFEALDKELTDRYIEARLRLNYPDWWATGRQFSLAIYALIRLESPNTVSESGVANGHSTYFIQNALIRNGRGTLTSFEIASEVGQLLAPEDRKGWELKILSDQNPADSFRASLGKFPSLDMFIHDSDHSYGWQLMEYETAWERMTEGSLLISDDVHTSYAFLDFCSNHDIRPVLLFDGRKMTGFARMDTSVKHRNQVTSPWKREW